MIRKALPHLYPDDRVARLALVGIYGFVLSIDLSTAGVAIFAAVVMLATLMRWRDFWRDMATQPVFWLVVALTGYVIVQSLVQIQLQPVLAQNKDPNWRHVAEITGLISLLFAWWMARFFRHVPFLLGALVLSLALGRLLEIDFDLLSTHGVSMRYAWGSGPTRVGYLAAVGVVLMGVVVAHLLIRTRLKDVNYWALLAGAGALLIGFGVVLYGTQTQGAWLGAVVALTGMLTFQAGRSIRLRKNVVKPVITAFLFLVAGFVVLAVDAGNVLDERLGDNPGLAQALLKLDREAVYGIDVSSGLRLNMWAEGLMAWWERPWFGWGVGNKPLIVERATSDIGGPKGHLHNIYIELLVSLGVVGALLFAAVFFGLFRRFILSAKAGTLPPLFVSIVLAVWAMTLIAVFTDIRIGQPSSRWLIIFLTALLATALVKDGKTRTEDASTHARNAEP